MDYSDLHTWIDRYFAGLKLSDARGACMITRWSVGRDNADRLRLIGRDDDGLDMQQNLLVGFTIDRRFALTTSGWVRLQRKDQPEGFNKKHEMIERELAFMREAYRLPSDA